MNPDVALALDDQANAWSLKVADGAGHLLYRAPGAFGSVAGVVGDDAILTSADGSVIDMSLGTGTVHWIVKVAGVPSTPAVIDGTVFVATDLGSVVAIGSAGASPGT